MNGHLLAFEESLKGSSSKNMAPLAKTIMMMMVRSLFSGLEFPYIQFLCNRETGDLLLQRFWVAIRRIGFMGLKVVGVTADGASSNRRFFRLHSLSTTTMPHCTNNPYAAEERNIFFFSDPPHLLKSARNAPESTKRNLYVSLPFSQFTHIHYSFPPAKC